MDDPRRLLPLTPQQFHMLLALTDGHRHGDAIIRDDGFRGNSVEVYTRRAPAELRRKQFPGGVRAAFALEMLDFLHAIDAGPPM